MNIKDTIEVLEHMLKIRRITMGVYPEDIEALSHAIQIAQAQEQAEGMLPEEKKVTWKCNCRGLGCKHCHSQGFNQAISIATPILAKKILECEEKDKRIEELKEKVIEIQEARMSARKSALEAIKELQSLKSKLTVGEFKAIIRITKFREHDAFVTYQDAQLSKSLLCDLIAQALIKELGVEV